MPFGYSNTDLKLQYGTPNITFLIQCDGIYPVSTKHIQMGYPICVIIINGRKLYSP